MTEARAKKDRCKDRKNGPSFGVREKKGEEAASPQKNKREKRQDHKSG